MVEIEAPEELLGLGGGAQLSWRKKGAHNAKPWKVVERRRKNS